MMRDARRGKFDVILVWASDRIARSVKHFLDVLDELSRIGVEFVSFRENIDTGGPLDRAIIVIIGAIAELERSLIVPSGNLTRDFASIGASADKRTRRLPETLFASQPPNSDRPRLEGFCRVTRAEKELGQFAFGENPLQFADPDQRDEHHEQYHG